MQLLPTCVPLFVSLLRCLTFSSVSETVLPLLPLTRTLPTFFVLRRRISQAARRAWTMKSVLQDGPALVPDDVLEQLDHTVDIATTADVIASLGRSGPGVEMTSLPSVLPRSASTDIREKDSKRKAAIANLRLRLARGAPSLGNSLLSLQEATRNPLFSSNGGSPLGTPLSPIASLTLPYPKLSMAVVRQDVGDLLQAQEQTLRVPVSPTSAQSQQTADVAQPPVIYAVGSNQPLQAASAEQAALDRVRTAFPHLQSSSVASLPQTTSPATVASPATMTTLVPEPPPTVASAVALGNKLAQALAAKKAARASAATGQPAPAVPYQGKK
jgi:hypothetical protein